MEMIVAINNKGFIGKENRIPWEKNAQDLRFFRETTMGKNLIMGRKTFESLPMILPMRKHFILTKRPYLHFSYGQLNFISVNQLPDNAIVIGGSEIYQKLFPLVEVVFISWINDDTEGDVKFPLWILNELNSSWTKHIIDQNQNITIEKYTRDYDNHEYSV